jgi:phage protein D
MGLGIAIALGDSPDEDLGNAVWVEVLERMGETTTYRIRYDIDVEQGDFPLLTDGRLDPGSTLAVIARSSGGKLHYLVKGPVTGQRVHYLHGVAGSYVEVLGADTSVIMDRETRSKLWADVADSDAVTSILGQPDYNVTPDVTDTQAQHLQDKHSLVQRDSDLRFVRRLARRNGFLFWIDCDETGTETAHFKRPVLDGEPALNLDINIDTNNLAALELSWDVERPTSVVASQLDLNDKSTIDGDVDKSPLTTLGTSSLEDITGDTRSVLIVAPVDDSGDLQGRGEGTLIESDWFVRATCQTSAKALGDIVRVNTVVDLRGVGTRHSGKYYVASVRHFIDLTMHSMEIELIRNGWGN